MELFVNYFYFSLLVYRNARDFCVVVQLLRLFVTSWIAACQASLSFSIFQSLLKLMSIKMVILIQLAPPLSSPFSPVLDCSPHQGLFSVNWLFSSGSQSIGASASTSVLPMNIQDWFPLGLTSFESPLDSKIRVFSSNTVWKHQLFGAQSSLWFNFHICTKLLEKS